jgi:ATP-binding protein involved in chromosome partitioning
MAAPTAERVLDALRAVLFPGFRRDVVTLGMVTDVHVSEDLVRVALRPGTDKPEVRQQLARAVEAALGRLPGVARIAIEMAGAEAGRGQDPFAGRSALPGVGHVVAVASAKGGVGKSTVAANLAVALAAAGHTTGLLDADVYGPSVDVMFGTAARPEVTPQKRIRPLERHGVRLMSMGFFVDDQSPVIWRGPIVMGIVRQFLKDVDWGETDFLIVDLPPGTGDAPLTLVQQVPLSGGVVVTTPQDVALLDVARGIAMFAQVSAPVLGVVENMSGYVCPQCGTEDAVFGRGGAEALAERFGLPLLARIPLVPALGRAGDAGTPLTVADPSHPVSRIFTALARRVADDAGRAAAGGAELST